MKKFNINILAMFIIFFSITACGERGPTGPEGPPGPEILPVSFEFNANLNQQNGFQFFQEIPGQIEVFEQDVMLAFMLEEILPEDDLEVWRKLPITEFNSRGTLLIDYDFTLIDVSIFLYANYELGINDSFQDVLIRAVHIPADFAAKASTTDVFRNVETLDELEQLLGVEVKKLK